MQQKKYSTTHVYCAFINNKANLHIFQRGPHEYRQQTPFNQTLDGTASIAQIGATQGSNMKDNNPFMT